MFPRKEVRVIAHPHSQSSEPRRGRLGSLYKRPQARKEASDGGSTPDLVFDGGTPNDANCHDQESSVDNWRAKTSDDNEEEASEEPDLNDIPQGPQNEAASISFGALAKAQISLGKRKRGHHDDDIESSRTIKTLRENLDSEALERKAGKKDFRDFTRSSKHAPAELSSKKAVSRKRDVVPTQKIDHRDPRFEPLSGPVDEQRTRKNYAFLGGYRDNEISDLRAAIRKTKDSEAKEKLKRALLGMESRKKAQETKDQQRKILRKHRKEEKGKIEKGKKPFYLKKADQKKLALVEKYEGMKGKEVGQIIERRWKKKAAKERRGMPEGRRQ